MTIDEKFHEPEEDLQEESDPPLIDTETFHDLLMEQAGADERNGIIRAVFHRRRWRPGKRS